MTIVKDTSKINLFMAENMTVKIMPKVKLPKINLISVLIIMCFKFYKIKGKHWTILNQSLYYCTFVAGDLPQEWKQL